MLRAANGLGDPTLQPWLLRVHYQAYDAYGKPRDTGTAEYLWAGPNRWRETFTEERSTWSEWNTEKGVYRPKAQTGDEPSYPASLLMQQFLAPLDINNHQETVPTWFAKETIGDSQLSCFSSRLFEYSGPRDENLLLGRTCTALDKPILLIILGSYNVFFQQPLAFQHRIISKRVLIKDGADSVIDVGLDVLKTPEGQELALLEPPPDAVLCPTRSSNPNPDPTHKHLLPHVEPHYPQSAKDRRAQGLVRFAVRIATDGRISNLALLHAPDPDLAHAAEMVVKDWKYTPYLVDGKPVEVDSQVLVSFTLGR